MTLERKPRRRVAERQYQKLVNIIRSCQVKLDFIRPVKGLVDMVFTANGALVVGKIAIVSNFADEPRRPESVYYRQFFQERGFQVETVKYYFEGEGDALFSHQRENLWVGYGFRTERLAVKGIRDLLGMTVYGLKLVDPYFYHLDTCFCPLPDGYLLYYPQAFDLKSRQLIHSIFDKKKLIAVTTEEAHEFVCNAICLWNNLEKQYVFIANRVSQRISKILTGLKISCQECGMSEFLLAGGSVKCCCLNVN